MNEGVPTNYKVIAEKVLFDLEQSVIGEMKKGWMPLGGVSAREAAPTGSYFQAMVKYE